MMGILQRMWLIGGRIVMILAAALIVSAGCLATVAVLPHVMPVQRLDRRPAEIRARRLQPALARRTASLARGLPDLALQVALVVGIAWTGRRIFGLRLKEQLPCTALKDRDAAG
jgi:hypothetical protein